MIEVLAYLARARCSRFQILVERLKVAGWPVQSFTDLCCVDMSGHSIEAVACLNASERERRNDEVAGEEALLTNAGPTVRLRVGGSFNVLFVHFLCEIFAE